MKWLLQLGAILLPLVCLLVPISEAFDRWDAPGLTHDTEFRLFVTVLLFVLVLLVSRLVAVLSLVITLIELASLPAVVRLRAARAPVLEPAIVPPMGCPPLRI